jgi:hypothetical protein
VQPKLNSYEVFWNRKRTFNNGGLCVTTRHCTLESTGREAPVSWQCTSYFKGSNGEEHWNSPLEGWSLETNSRSSISGWSPAILKTHIQTNPLVKNLLHSSALHCSGYFTKVHPTSKPLRIRIQSRCEEAPSGGLFAISDCTERLLGLWGNARGLLGPPGANSLNHLF